MASGQNSLQTAFQTFSKFGNSKSDGTTITLSQIDKWIKQAGLFNKTLTTTDTGIEFNKFKSKTLDFKNFEDFLNNLCKIKKQTPEDFREKLISCGLPGTSNTTKTVATGGVDRLTDTTKYTGSHKERFDESGKGKGREGRSDNADDSGYVGGYKEKDTYDKKH